MIKLKRAYEPPDADDGVRVLVDRVWPRGVTKERLELASWERDIAPSTELRRWFGHDPARWETFRERYRQELAQPEHAATLAQLEELARQGTLTLVYGAHDTEHNQAVVLKELLDERLGSSSGA